MRTRGWCTWNRLAIPNDVPDFRPLWDIAHQHGLPVIVDKTVLTPALFRPFEHGIYIAVYSATKFLGGHGVRIGARAPAPAH